MATSGRTTAGQLYLPFAFFGVIRGSISSLLRSHLRSGWYLGGQTTLQNAPVFFKNK
jgi:hypothetical protein